MKRVLNLGNLSRIVEGDPNEITDNEILVIKDKGTEGKILDIQKVVNGKLVSLIAERYTFTINPIPNDATVVINGSITKSIKASKGQVVTWSISRKDYIPKFGSSVILSDELKTVMLGLRLPDV